MLANSTGCTIIVFVPLIAFTFSTTVATAAEYWLYCLRLAVKFEPSTVVPSFGNLVLAPSCYRCKLVYSLARESVVSRCLPRCAILQRREVEVPLSSTNGIRPTALSAR